MKNTESTSLSQPSADTKEDSSKEINLSQPKQVACLIEDDGKGIINYHGGDITKEQFVEAYNKIRPVEDDGVKEERKGVFKDLSHWNPKVESPSEKGEDNLQEMKQQQIFAKDIERQMQIRIDQLMEQREELITKLMNAEDKHKIELSNYAYQMDLAKRERNQAEEKVIQLELKLNEGQEALAKAWGDGYDSGVEFKSMLTGSDSDFLLGKPKNPYTKD